MRIKCNSVCEVFSSVSGFCWLLHKQYPPHRPAVLGAESRVMNERSSLPSGGSASSGRDRCILLKVQGRLDKCYNRGREGNGNPKEGIEKASQRLADIFIILRG